MLRHRDHILTEAERRPADQLFAALVAVEDVTATCYHDDVWITVRGISREAWRDFTAGARSLPLPRFTANLRLGRGRILSVDLPPGRGGGEANEPR